jgi:hypothetical protein
MDAVEHVEVGRRQRVQLEEQGHLGRPRSAGFIPKKREAIEGLRGSDMPGFLFERCIWLLCEEQTEGGPK